mmetsp:Transcript_319/g.505  ORF Transcript_319/g.505 Transcript_319/m.505 type:complete len:462 (-) Transcript_319:520-1905(-)
MSRGPRNSSWQIAKIFKDITWDAGIVARSAFRGIHKPRRKIKPKPTEYVKFVYKGQYYRRPIAPRQKKNKSDPPKLLKLPPAGPQVVPQPFITPPTSAAQTAEALVASKPTAGGGSSGSSQQSTWSWRSWWKLNAPLVVINFGSLATLMGFTRSDVLELRSLAITGNVSFVVYSLLQPPPIRWAACIWSILFASVNGVKIAQILHEREGKVHLTPHEETIYYEHFQPHGVTPKQFERVKKTGKTRIIEKGGVLSRRGEQMDTVKLVVHGNTRANVMGRHLTAMGSVQGNRHSQGGDAGAWVGEMAFLQSLWDRDHAMTPLQKKLTATQEGPDVRSGPLTPSDVPYKYCAISTIVAVDECEVIEWSFEDMEKVMKSSRYMQDSMTRAMTAAIVGKVMNFMVSRQSAMPKWSTMMDNWNYPTARRRQDEDMGESEEEEEEDVSRTVRNQPLATSAQWILRPRL